MSLIKNIYLLAILLLSISCSVIRKSHAFTRETVYKTSGLTITRIAPDVYQHTSYLTTESFGTVSCNGMIVTNRNESVVFDTPVSDTVSSELINWINQHLKSRITAIVPTHFHKDCLGGLNEFHKNNIPSYAYFRTIEFAKANQFPIPINSFNDSLNLSIGSENVLISFFGEGHTKDNIVAYYPAENILFGGCLIKELNAGKGNLEDANEDAWPQTVKKIQQKYPYVKKVIPGHGEIGNFELLNYTIDLFSN